MVVAVKLNSTILFSLSLTISSYAYSWRVRFRSLSVTDLEGHRSVMERNVRESLRNIPESSNSNSRASPPDLSSQLLNDASHQHCYKWRKRIHSKRWRTGGNYGICFMFYVTLSEDHRCGFVIIGGGLLSRWNYIYVELLYYTYLNTPFVPQEVRGTFR